MGAKFSSCFCSLNENCLQNWWLEQFWNNIGTLNHDLNAPFRTPAWLVILDYLNGKTFLPLISGRKSTSKLPVLIYHHVSIVSMKHVFVPTKLLNLRLAVLNVSFNGWVVGYYTHLAQWKRFRKLNGSSPQGWKKNKNKAKSDSGWIYGQTRNISDRFLRYLTCLLHSVSFDLGGSKTFKDHLEHVVFQDVWRHWNIIANRIEG